MESGFRKNNCLKFNAICFSLTGVRATERLAPGGLQVKNKKYKKFRLGQAGFNDDCFPVIPCCLSLILSTTSTTEIIKPFENKIRM